MFIEFSEESLTANEELVNQTHSAAGVIAADCSNTRK